MQVPGSPVEWPLQKVNSEKVSHEQDQEISHCYHPPAKITAIVGTVSDDGRDSGHRQDPLHSAL